MYGVVPQCRVQPVHIAIAGDVEISNLLLVSDDQLSDDMSPITAQLVPAQGDPGATTADDIRGTWSRRGD